MTILGVVHLGHPALRVESAVVDKAELGSREFQQFLDDLAGTCVVNNGVGIAAPQVGVNKRVIVVNVDPDNQRYPGRERFPLTIVVNPVVVARSADVNDDWEGDLSAGLRGIVPRSSTCTVTGIDRGGEAVEFKLGDPFHARVFQHEIDHLDGVFFIDRVQRHATLAELPEWETYWKGSQPFGIAPEWEAAAMLLMRLTHDLSAWASVVLVPNAAGDALRCAAHYRLPLDWAQRDNRLDSGSKNSRAYASQQEVVANGINEDLPPGGTGVSRHRMTASAVVPIPGVGTLEVLANSDGYHFHEQQLTAMRDVAKAIGRLRNGHQTKGKA